MPSRKARPAPPNRLPDPIQVQTSVPTRYHVDTVRPATMNSSCDFVVRLFQMPTPSITAT
jgi:hypothetical protein